MHPQQPPQVPPLEQAASGSAELEKILSLVHQHCPGRPLRILEAGCGQKWSLQLGQIPIHLTGVDMDAEALRLRKDIVGDLDETILGDLRSIELPAGSFDVIYSAFVLEHIDSAENVLRSFFNWVRDGGIVIIRVPDPHSVQGFVTRTSPHWFHVFYYKYILGKKMAGKPGYVPYRTYYTDVISRSGIRSFVTANNVSLEFECGDAYWRPRHRHFDKSINLIKRLLAAVSLGYIQNTHTNLLFVLRKNPTNAKNQSRPTKDPVHSIA